MDFDALRAAVVPGVAVVGRWPGVVCVAECADRQVLRRLLEVCSSSAGAEAGRALARRLAMWLGGPDAPGDGLRFGTVAVTGGDPRAAGQRGEQWAVFLYGAVGVVVPDRQVALSGAQSVAWTDRLLPRPDAPVVLALEGGPIPPGVVDGVHDLRAGIVPGAGVVLVPGGGPAQAEVADERGRPDDARWPETSAPERRWTPEPTPGGPSDGLFAGDGPPPGGGNGLPARGSLGPFDAGPDPDPGRDRPSGRPHLRPVPSATNGVAHRGWMPRRGSTLDTGRFPDADERRSAGPAEEDPASDERGVDRGVDRGPDRPVDHPVERSVDHPLEHPLDHPLDHRGGPNGARPRTNGATHDLLGGSSDASPKEPERSPWSDGRGRDVGRPERIEGWFATPDDGGTEAGLRAVGPSELRRPRHGRPDHDDTLGVDTPDDGPDAGPLRGDDDDHGSGEFGPAEADEFGAAVEEFGAAVTGEYEAPGRGEYDSPARAEFGGLGVGADGDFGRDRGPETGDPRSGAGGGEDVRPAQSGGPADDDDLDGAGDGTPRLGVPAQEAPPEPEPQPLAPDAGGADRDATQTAALRSERILGAAGEPDRAALEDGPVTGGLVVDTREDEPEVRGYRCGRGHLNDPRAQFCAMCGARMEEPSGPPAPGPRPPLGLLVFDDGATYTVDAEYLMGRMPEADPRVASGALRPLALEDTSGAVSRVHAQIIVNGWDALLVDAGSRNGTFVSPPGEQGWTQLPAGETHRLVPGTRVRIGGRSFLFEAPSGAH